MKKKMFNDVRLQGYLYEQNLALKVTGENSKAPGTEFISGTIGIATDEEMLNIVQVHYTYVTAVTSKGRPNNTFNALRAIIDGKMPTVMNSGKDLAARIRIDSAIALNEFYVDRDGKEELVSAKRVEGGFVHQMTIAEAFEPEISKRATFDCDMMITKAVRKEADEERNLPEKLILGGYIFDFRKAIMPVEFSVLNPSAMNYFENQEPSGKHPLFTRVKGHIVSQTIERKIEEEGAFGEPSVRTVRNSHRDYVVTWAAAEPYEFDNEDTLLASEVTKALADREVFLADMKKRQDEYQASRGSAIPASTAVPAAAKKDYDF